MPPRPIDPPDAPKLALRGRVVTMNAARKVLADGIAYLEKGDVVAVRAAGAAAPKGFGTTEPIATGGTIYPGLIELHNHLPYNVLQLWHVPKKYVNRDGWDGDSNPDYRKLISGPMRIMGQSPGLLPAVARWVELKCLLAGVTSTQGIKLFSNAGTQRALRGIVRNVEGTGDPQLPDAGARVGDVPADETANFISNVAEKRCYLLHLSEGLDAAARKHFLGFKQPDGKWALAPSLTGIHAAALKAADLAVLGKHACSIVWSPLSNLLLYGGTADIATALDEGLKVGLGSDWAPSGSKNLLGELKAARAWSDLKELDMDDRRLVEMVTRDAAAILGWDGRAGAVAPKHRADLTVLSGTTGDPYAKLVRAGERDVSLVLVNGVPRAGTKALMKACGIAKGEKVGPRVVNLALAAPDPDVESVSATVARKRLTDAFGRLPALAKELEKAKLQGGMPAGTNGWYIVLDEHEGAPAPKALLTAAAEPLSELLKGVPFELDPLTIADDPTWLDRLAAQPNLPKGYAERVADLYA